MSGGREEEKRGRGQVDPEKSRRPRDCVVKAEEVIQGSETGRGEVEVPPLGRRGLG